MKIFITMGQGETRDSFFTPRVLKELDKLGDVKIYDGSQYACSKEELMEEIKETEILFSGWGAPRIDAEVLAHADKLRIHAHTGGSVAAYTSLEEYGKGIHVLSGNDLYAKSVAEGCLTYTLSALRRIPEYVEGMRQTGWRPLVDTTQGLIKKKIGLVGYGAIARYYAELLKWFEVDLSIYSKYISPEELKRVGAKPASMEEIFSDCDIISLHSALNQENRGTITKNLFQMIKEGALFVNTARAGLMDTAGFIEELETERFQAVLDVYDEEPLSNDSRLRSLPNVTLFPHIAGPTFDMREQVVLTLIEDILNLDRGLPAKSAIPYEYAIRMTQ